MKLLPLAFLAASFFTPVILFAEASKLPEVPTKSEAIAIIAAEGHARDLKEANHKVTLEAVPASREWEVDHGNRKTVIRRIAPPPPPAMTHSESSVDQTSTETKWTEEEIAAWLAEHEQPVHRVLNLTAVVYDQVLTEITWRGEDQREWTILSNIDFRYLGGIGRFEDETYRWMTFLFVYEISSEDEKQTARLAAEKGFSYEPRTAEHWLSLLPQDFLSRSKPEYLILSADERTAIPPALYEELDALHHYYLVHEKRLIAQYKRNKVMNEARRAWREANPPEPKDTVINFWKVE